MTELNHIEPSTSFSDAWTLKVEATQLTDQEFLVISFQRKLVGSGGRWLESSSQYRGLLGRQSWLPETCHLGKCSVRW